MRWRRGWSAVIAMTGFLTVGAMLGAAGCSDDGPGDDDGSDSAPSADARAAEADAAPSGRACDTGAELDDATVIATPALECPTRLCVHVAGAQPDSCTSPCDTAEDCVAAPESSCQGAFVCTEVVDTGPFACRSFCVCETSVPAGGFVTCAEPNVH